MQFWARVERTNDCWLWTGSRNNKGYGSFRLASGERPLGAHRVMWEIHNGPIPPRAVVMHLCDNPPCVRPLHLVVGGQAANIIDSYRKGRHSRYNAAKTHCPQGHEYDLANTYTYQGRRSCRTCRRENRRVWAPQNRGNAFKTHCKRGHEFTPENTWRESDGHRHCRICRRSMWLAWARRTGRIST